MKRASSKLFVEQQIASNDDWTEHELLERRKEIEVWALDRWHIEAPPPEPEVAPGIDGILALGDQRQVGEELRALLDAVKKHPISPRYWKFCVAFRPQFDSTLSVFTAYPHENHFWFKIYHWNLVKYQNADPAKIKQLFGEKHWQRLEKDEIYQFISKLNSFFGELEE